MVPAILLKAYRQIMEIRPVTTSGDQENENVRTYHDIQSLR